MTVVPPMVTEPLSFFLLERPYPFSSQSMSLCIWRRTLTSDHSRV